MTSLHTPVRSSGSIEPLEARIAPAVIYIGAQGLDDDTITTPHNNPLDTDYVDPNPGDRPGKIGASPAANVLNFVDIFDGSVNGGAANPFDTIAAALRGNVVDGTALDPTPHRYFYLRLHAGDSVVTYTSGNYQPGNPLISVTGGDVIAVFTDFTNDGQHENNYDPDEFTGLILGPGAKVQVNGGVNGDIVTGLDTHKTANTADDTLDLKTLVGARQNIGNLKVLGGAVKGSILGGGNIDNMTVLSGSVDNVLVGSAANSVSFDLVRSPLFPTGRFTTSIDYAPGTVGASINNSLLHDVLERVEAGAGGFGAKGGSLSNITINADTDGLALIAGDGGNVDAASHKTVGGAGGSLTKINIQGTPDPTPNSTNPAIIVVQGAARTIDGFMLVAGDGGGSVVGNTAVRGGVGGSITGTTAGLVKTNVANDLSSDSFHLFGGVGGNGKTGGAGGSILTTNIVITTPDGLGHEIEVVAGDGGTGGVAGVKGGAAGAGGNITTLVATNTFSSIDPTVSVHASTFVHGGDGGLTLDPSATGAAGGSIKTVTLIGYDSDISAGSGSDGNSGGKGGSVSTLVYNTNQTVITHNIMINAGEGGKGVKLAGGAGGAITGVKAPVVDLETLYINTVPGAGEGGNSDFGRGGVGGAVSTVDVSDVDKAGLNTAFINGDVLIKGGKGGSGGAGGGAGGALNTIRVEGDHFAVNAAGGQGGNATIKGAGGAGGLVNVFFVRAEGALNAVDLAGNPILINPTGTVAAGTGGNGVGALQRGGAGGDLKSVSLSVEGDGMVMAGKGGDGQVTAGLVKGGAAGKGGLVSASGLISEFGSGAITAGDAGTNGGAAAAGGAIVGSALTAVNGVRAAQNVTIRAGSGSHGGAGGDITTLGFAGADPTTAPAGKVLVQAGNGSGEGSAAGRGGNLTGITGVASTLADGSVTTLLAAGSGGGGVGVKLSGAGGSVSTSTIATGGGAGAIIVVEAGNAGNSTLAKTGGKGGSVNDVGFAALATGTVLRSVAAGEGGVGTSTGGAGGSVTKIFAPNNDIGYRTGQDFGYAKQGGVFAGLGGAGGVKNGLNGSVAGVTATAVSSIVAGARNSLIPHLAEKVSDISLNGTTAQLLLGRNDIFVADGDFVLTFKGESTALIKGRAPSSNENPNIQTIQSELNKLSTIQAVGGVIVEYTTNGGYRIQFNQKGNQPLIDAVEIVTRDVVESIPNSSLALAFATPTDGSVDLPITASQPGVTPFSATVTVPGSNLFVAAEVVSGNVNSNTPEVESIDVSSLVGIPNAEFTLSFVGETTVRMLATTDAATVEAELNKLTAITNAGGVTVTQNGAVFTINFVQPGREPLISGQSFLQETERLDLSGISGSASSQFTLTFNGATTGPIPLAAGAGAIQTELNNLITVKSTNVAQTGSVVVTPAGPGMFDITFSENGFQSPFSGVASVPESQTIHVTGTASDTFVIKSGDQKTVELKLGSTAEQVQTALNKLPNIVGVSGVTVVKNGLDYLVKFNSVGTQSLLEAKLFQKEKQSVDLSTVSGTTTDYTVHSEYPVDVNENHPGVTKLLPVPDGDPLTLLRVPGDNAGSGRVANVTLGTSTVSQVDRINFGATGGGAAALKDGDLFILKYTDTLGNGGSTENSIVIPYNTNINFLAGQIQAALNAMPLLKGGVTVIKDPTGGGATFPNAVQITYTAKAQQVPLQTEVYTPTAHPGGYTVPITGSASSGFGGTTQVVNLTSVVPRGGTFRLTIAGQQTSFIPTSNSVTVADITAALNVLSAVSDFGGVTVAETAPGSHVFTLSFPAGQLIPPITGEAIVPESEVLNVSNLTLDPTDEFTLTFRGDKTPILPQNASAALIQTELNKLPSVQALGTGGTGRVRVFATGPNAFRVDFPNYTLSGSVKPDQLEPDFLNIVISSGGDVTHEIQHLDLRSLTAYADGLFKLSFGSDTTTVLPQDATALDIQNALNNLNAVIQTREDVNVGFTGAVAVTQTAHGEFDVKFNVFGQKTALSGSGTVNTDRFPVTVTQTSNGVPATILVSEQSTGAYIGLPVSEQVHGTAGNPETQRLDVSSFNGAGLGDFTVTFGSGLNARTTAPIAFTGGVAPTAAQVQAAINALPNLPVGGVAVTGANGVYDVTFGNNGDQTAFVLQGRHPEVQQLDLGSLYTSPLGEYSLDFGGQKTAILAHDATAAQIQTALNSLSTVQNAGGVTVAQVGNSSQFTVTFGGLGNPANIVASGGLTQEVQRISLGEIVGRTDAQFRLTFNGQTTGLLSANLSSAALAAEIQTALNGLETINDTRTSAANPAHTVSAIGQVSVVAGEEGNFYVTFDARGDVPTISGYSVTTTDRIIPVTTSTNGASTPVTVNSVDGTAGTSEVQKIDLSTLTVAGANSEFQLQFDNNAADGVSGYTTGLLKAGATPADTAVAIQIALNGLPSIAAAGGVTVSANGAVNTTFDVQFNQIGNQEAISGAVGQHEIQSVDVRALDKFHVSSSTTVPGDAVTQEHQRVDLTGARTDFTLQFGTDQTVSLPTTATITDIENALNILPSVQAAGGVTVAPVAGTAIATRVIEVTFNSTGDVAQITGTADSADGVFRLGLNGALTQAQRVGLLDPNGPTTAQSLIDLTDALNALPEIQALAGHDLGKVSVTLVNGSYQIEFLGLGDQATLTAGGTFSVEAPADIHRTTDGNASSTVPLPIAETTPGRAIGPVAATVTQGAVNVNEVQQFDLSQEFNGGSGFVIFNFNNDPNAGQLNVTGANPAAAIQTYLNNLPSVQAVGPVTVTETAPGSHVFNVAFSTPGNQPALTADDTFGGISFTPTETQAGAVQALEVQKLDLNSLPNATFQVQFGGAAASVTLNGADQAANAAILDSALDNLGTIPGGVTVTSNADANGGFGTFNITFNNSGDVAQIGATSFITTEATMGGVTNEVQHLDLTALQGAATAGSSFALSYNGEVTTALSRFATAADVQAALNNLPQFAGTPVTVTGSNGAFDVKFGDTVDHAGLILAQAGNQEVQHLDTTQVPDFRLTFNGQQTGTIATGAPANQVEFALNQLPSIQQAGGVTVAASPGGGYDVQFNTFANQPSITGEVAVHEQLILDLHNYQNETGFITFQSGGNKSISVPTTAFASQIETAINSITSNVLVSQLHPGVFQISYTGGGAQPLLEAFVNKQGNSVRVPSNASATELESAIDNISVSDTSLTGANGLYQITYADNGDQILSTGTANVHQQVRPDIFAGQGSFRIIFGAEQTPDLPFGATADQIRLALNSLSIVQDFGGVKDVVVNPDSSFRVTFAGDGELAPGPATFVIRQDLLADNVKTIVDGSVNTREVQTLSYTIQGAFDQTKFLNARLVGAIADYNEFDSNRFHFYDLTQPGAHLDVNGIPVDVNNVPLNPTVATPGNPFTEGDLPIDGIVMAKVIDQKTVFVIPEAALIQNPDKTVGGNLFQDYLNGR